MIYNKGFEYEPGEHEAESASNGYLMSLVALIVALPLPIVNVIASFIFFLNSRKSTYFVRWHATQALLSQLSTMVFNSIGFWWAVSIILDQEVLSSEFIAYLFSVLLFNLIEFVATIYTAIQVRKGKHVEWWLFGTITNDLCKPKP